MKGIYYDRRANESQRDEWSVGEAVVVSRSELLKFLSNAKVEGKIKWRCDEADEEICRNCTACMNIEVSQKNNGDTKYSYTNEPPTYDQVGEFSWNWSGCGVVEHWFDNKAVCLKKTSEPLMKGLCRWVAEDPPARGSLRSLIWKM